MGGFVCVLDETKGPIFDNDKESLKKMTKLLSHRGSNEEGYIYDESVQFGFRRLSIFDKKDGHLPITYENKRYMVVFDGEIYNGKELQKELTLDTNNDEEVIVALYSQYKEKTCEKLRGMFAFVIWDKEEKLLYGARDPFGNKPLFFYENMKKTIFASEKKSILYAVGKEGKKINEEALQHYFTYQYVPEPYTMAECIRKLEPGHFFVKKVGFPMKIEPYWKASFHTVQKREQDYIKEIRDILYESVKLHMRGDVSIGAFLSGGIDSSFVVSIAKEFLPSLKTFSVGFQLEGFNEIDVAKETAEKIGVENISYLISPEEFMKEIPKIIWHLDDPLADPACIALYFAAREARKHVQVVLSGEGADEFFGGYNIYREPQSLAIFNYIPKMFHPILKKVATKMPTGMKGKSFIERGVTPLEERYIGNAKMFSEEEKRLLLKAYNDEIQFTNITKPLYEQAKGYGPVERMQYIDLHTWMRGDILLKADRMTMAHSLEVRTPFLDKAVFEVASQIPTSLKTANRTTKYILREAAKGIVPEHVLNRKKLGFPVPIRHWLKEELYDWAIKIIRESQVDQLIDKNYCLRLLDEHCQGKGDYSRKIWTVLMFMVWYQVYIEEKYSFGKEYAKEKVLMA